jgi:type VI secretion system secreted protein VgrG
MPIRCVLQQQTLGDRLPVVRLDAREGLSELFEVDAWFFHESPDVAVEDVIWQEALVEAWEDDRRAAGLDDGTALFHGVVEEAAYLRPHRNGHLYRVVLRPTVHGLAWRVRSRIFQDADVPDIVERVLREAGVPAERVARGLPAYPPREYCTQWKESELAFVTRLLEEEGCFFWFEHGDGGHVLHLDDDAAVFAPLEGDPSIPVVRNRSDAVDAEYAWGVRARATFTHDRVTARDWNWETPTQTPEASVTARDAAPSERYDFPGYVATSARAKVRATRALEAERLRARTLTGSTTSRRLRPGRRFHLHGAAFGLSEQGYLMIRAEHRFRHPDLEGQEGADAVWTTSFEAIPGAAPFRPPRVTPRPRVHGLESAVVTSRGGEEVWVDRYGRVKVHFYWDREGPVDDTASCWIRVQQLNTAATMALPRVGWEVDVGFLYGDPDRPVVLQKLYNNETMPPYELPASLSRAALQSASSPGGGGTNELRMEDGDGGMELFVHAQRDMATTVNHHRGSTVVVDAMTQVGVDADASVTGDESVTVGGDMSLSVTGLLSRETLGALSVTVGGLDDIKVKSLHTTGVVGDRTETIGGLMSVIAQKVSERFGAAHSRSVGGVQLLTAGDAISTTTAGTYTELVGGARVIAAKGSVSENVAAAKALTTGFASLKAGTDVQITSQGARATTAGGPVVIQCGGDLAISGASVQFTCGSLTLDAGGKIKATPGSVKLDAGAVDGDAASVDIRGSITLR